MDRRDKKRELHQHQVPSAKEVKNLWAIQVNEVSKSVEITDLETNWIWKISSSIITDQLQAKPVKQRTAINTKIWIKWICFLNQKITIRLCQIAINMSKMWWTYQTIWWTKMEWHILIQINPAFQDNSPNRIAKAKTSFWTTTISRINTALSTNLDNDTCLQQMIMQ